MILAPSQGHHLGSEIVLSLTFLGRILSETSGKEAKGRTRSPYGSRGH